MGPGFHTGGANPWIYGKILLFGKILPLTNPEGISKNLTFAEVSKILTYGSQQGIVMLINLFLSLSLKTVFEFMATAETAMGSGLHVRLNNIQMVGAYHRAVFSV